MRSPSQFCCREHQLPRRFEGISSLCSLVDQQWTKSWLSHIQKGNVILTDPVLLHPRPRGYNANNPDHFHSHMMIECAWNRPGQQWHTLLGMPRPGPEVSRGRTNLVWVATRAPLPGYGNYRDLPISYEPSEQDIRRRMHHDLCLNPADFNRYLNGGAAEVWDTRNFKPEILLLIIFLRYCSWRCRCLQLRNVESGLMYA